MIVVGIDVAKDKHDCFIMDSEGTVLFDVFTVPNTLDGFNILLDNIKSVADDLGKIKVGLEATGHYSYNLLGFLLNNGLATYVLNPLHTNLYRKSLTLRKTKTDKVDARVIASMLMSCVDLKPYTSTLYQNEELKSMTRYRFDKVSERAKLKSSVSRLVTILFPELEKLVPSLHMKSVYALLAEFPSAQHIANAHLTRLTNLLSEASKGRYGKDKAIQIRDAARRSIGSVMPAKSLELKHTIKLIADLTEQIHEINNQMVRLKERHDQLLLRIKSAEGSDEERLSEIARLEQEIATMPEWRSEARSIFVMHFTTQPNMSAPGTRPLLIILPRSEPRASTTTLLYLTPSRNLYGSFLLLKNLICLISLLFKLFGKFSFWGLTFNS